jgi:meso-butanediol dehydrogenase / (S,S)-butanediol dehydrogenase / diacetyl reductase
MSKAKVALITGAARGIGLAAAHALTADGWRVGLADRDAAALETAVAEVGGGAFPVLFDVGNIVGCRAAVADVVQTVGRLDCLVNNAGVFKNELILDTEEETFDRIMTVNVKGAYFLTQAAAKAMLETGGGIVINIASAAGRSGRPTQAVYGMSKAALIHFTKSAAIAFAPHIRTVCICPAAIDTDMMKENLAQRRAVGGEADAMAFLAKIPLGRMGTAQEVADLVAFLASDKAAYINGGSIDISGGLDMH